MVTNEGQDFVQRLVDRYNEVAREGDADVYLVRDVSDLRAKVSRLKERASRLRRLANARGTVARLRADLVFGTWVSPQQMAEATSEMTAAHLECARHGDLDESESEDGGST